MKKLNLVFAIAATLGLPTGALAQTGPVAKMCAAEIQKYCTGKEHTSRQVRTCLEANREKVSSDCRAALDSSGGGRGR
jgi:hypothetical protein